MLRVGELPAYGWVPPGIDNYTSQSFDYRDAADGGARAEAHRLYKAAGYSREQAAALRAALQRRRSAHEGGLAIASMWQEALGAQVRLTQVEFKSLLQDIDRGDVEMFRSSWVGDYNDAYTFAQYLKSDFGINLPHYRSAQYDALLAARRRADDPAQRRNCSRRPSA